MAESDTDALRLSDLHGSRLTVERDGEREVLTGFACDDYPDCDVCGHLDEEHAQTDESDEPDAAIESEGGVGYEKPDSAPASLSRSRRT